jgi:DNA-binding CsgD family transcriptional regulator/pimeloyl-ACP methyl ester carboxylesterase
MDDAVRHEDSDRMPAGSTGDVESGRRRGRVREYEISFSDRWARECWAGGGWATPGLQVMNELPMQYARSADGTNIAFVELGQGPPLLVIPALGVANGDVDPAFAPSCLDHFKMVVFDRRGSGHSSRKVPVTLELLVQDCLAVADAAGIESFHINSYYVGAFEAVRVVLETPGRVRGLILNDPFLPGFADSLPSTAWQASLEVDWDWFVEAYVRTWGEPEPGDRVVPGLIDHFKATNDPDSFRALVKMLGEIDDTGPLERIKIPTLVIHRERFPQAAQSSNSYASRIPGAKLATSRGSHASNLSDDAEGVLQEFLTGTLPLNEVPRSWLGPSPTAAAAPAAGLSDREAEVLRLVTMGCSNREIAAELTLSLPTVATHLRHILDKLGVENRAAAAAWAVRAGLA